jgi:hypothetical protein
MTEDERGALLDLLEWMVSNAWFARRLVNARQQNRGDDRQRRGHAESRRRAGPSDERAAERWSGRKGTRARKFNPGIGDGECLSRDQCGHQRGRRDAEHHRRADSNETKQREQRPGDQIECNQYEKNNQRRGAHCLSGGHQSAPRHAVRHYTCGNCEDEEWQGQRRLQQAGLTRACAERKHRHDRGGSKRDLLSRLGGKIGPGQAIEFPRQPWCVIHALQLETRRAANHPFSVTAASPSAPSSCAPRRHSALCR